MQYRQYWFLHSSAPYDFNFSVFVWQNKDNTYLTTTKINLVIWYFEQFNKLRKNEDLGGQLCWKFSYQRWIILLEIFLSTCITKKYNIQPLIKSPGTTTSCFIKIVSNTCHSITTDSPLLFRTVTAIFV